MNLYKTAILKADAIRTRLGLNMFQPVNIFDSCVNLDVTVRFVDINMEGFYVKQQNGLHPTIIISNQRPLPRRCFTCAHELGHHVFNHGLKLDILPEQQADIGPKDLDEQLVDSFAGALLMPLAGIQKEFTKRNWSLQKSTPIEFYTISSIFGVGYHTLIVHCKANNLISEQKANSLLKFKPAKILESLLGASIKEKSYFKIIDGLSQLSTIDLEVKNYIFLPTEAQVEGNHLQKFPQAAVNKNNVYIATKPGIVRVSCKGNSTSCFIRIQNFGYVGLAENRHLETETD